MPESNAAFKEIAIHEEDDTVDTTRVRIDKFYTIEGVHTHLYCVNCSKRIIQASSGSVIKCDNKKCNYIMRTLDCPTKSFVTVVLKQMDDSELHLCLNQEILEDVVKQDMKSLTEMELAPHLFNLRNIEVTYNADRIITNIVLFDMLAQ